MDGIAELPELSEFDNDGGLVRIAPQIDVPLSQRVRHLIDTREFRRLARISQLGLVSLVYPSATHTRFEHSLGVYRLALLYLKRLARDPRFAEKVNRRDGELFIVAALLHDLGHWPFCHPIEDMQLPRIPSHELFANSFLLEGEIADVLRDEWQIQPREIVSLLSEKPRTTTGRILHSLLSGPIDIDKMDYLARDSLHAGVPYGHHFDQNRLIGSLCLNRAGDGLAITSKGKTAAEMMVFARYVMFSEVYWHHSVRSATAMLQRAFYVLHGDLEMDQLFRLSEPEMIEQLRNLSDAGSAADLIDGLFGPNRLLYKMLAEYNTFQQPDIYQRLARRPYPWLAACGGKLAELASTALGKIVAPHELLIDAPPVGREVEFNIEIHYAKENVYRRLDEVSPVVHTLAKKQFDEYVKQVRIFTHPRLAGDLSRRDDLEPLIEQAITLTDG